MLKRTRWPLPILSVLALVAAGSAVSIGAIRAARADDAHWIDAPMSKWMENVTHEPVTQGNSTELLVDGTSFYPVRLQMIRDTKAGDTIDLLTFLWCDDEAGLTVARELAAAAQRGVRVRVMVDIFNNKPHEQAYSILKKANVTFQEFNTGNINIHDHEKIMVVNGDEALIGGANLCDEYMIGGSRNLWHDLEIHAKGPVASRVQARYDSTWNWMANKHRRYDLIYGPTPTPDYDKVGYPGNDTAMLAYQQAYMSKDDSQKFRGHTNDDVNNFEALYSELIKRAQHHVIIYDAYVNYPVEMKDAIIETARRGVKIDIVTNSAGTNDMGEIFVKASEGWYGDFIKTPNITIWAYQPRTTHAKAILIDDTLLAVGSHNFTVRSFNFNGESNILTGNPDAIARFKQLFADDHPYMKPVTWDEIQGMANKPKDSVLLIVGRWFSHLF